MLFGWIGARKPDPMRGPRLAPYRFLMLLFAAVVPELRRISDEWLARHSGGEKGFSMGSFVERYVAEFPCALVRKEGASSQ